MAGFPPLFQERAGTRTRHGAIVAALARGTDSRIRINMLDPTYSISDYMVMKLDAYLSEKRVTEMKLAALAGCSQSTISKIRRGNANPTADMLRRICIATGGLVTVADLLSPIDEEVAA